MDNKDNDTLINEIYEDSGVRRLIIAKVGQYLELRNGTAMIRARDMGRLYKMGEGMYKVGSLSSGCDIEPGTYKIEIESASDDYNHVYYRLGLV